MLDAANDVIFGGVITIFVSLLLGVLTLVGVFRMSGAYFKGDLKGVKKEIVGFAVVCFFLGVFPGLGPISVNLGESIVKPVNALVTAIAEQVTSEATKSVQK